MDPQNKIVYEMHQYLDLNEYGTSAPCVSITNGKERVTATTQWLNENGKIGILGEFAGGVNDQGKTALTGMLDDIAETPDIYLFFNLRADHWSGVYGDDVHAGAISVMEGDLGLS